MEPLFDETKLEPIRAWALANVRRFQPNGFGRQFASLHLFTNVPAEVWKIKLSIIERFGLRNTPPEPLYRDLCSLITRGGAVHMHRDPNQGGLIHTRFNVMISKPQAGGQPIIDNEILDVPEGGIYRVDAGLKLHGTTAVLGDRPRIILSFGFLCSA
ncbi:hypothetical protein [Trinickia fusca]|uniref:Fe2OG dioxygenase domain-containing protein n=1 Tax=Trinickia fusca TaxID=2419777 RepID=A0A494XA95_9BURK|nr:hypothetical protein [Trinickia fusca]RKP47022.1 hypothetical protein D7S89_16125 [Trinickia fusca]